MKRIDPPVTKTVFTLNEKDVIDAVIDRVLLDHQDVAGGDFTVTVAVSKKGVYSAIVEVLV